MRIASATSFNLYQNNSTNASNTNSKIYSSIDDMAQSLNKQGEAYAANYLANNKETSSVDSLINELKNEFPQYTMTSSEPSDVVNGKHYLYIDETNLQKMVDDPSYKAKVMGLIKREISATSGFSFKQGNETVTGQMTGSVFSLSEKNEKDGGIPYSGSCQCSFSASSSNKLHKGTFKSDKNSNNINKSSFLERLKEINLANKEKYEDSKQKLESKKEEQSVYNYDVSAICNKTKNQNIDIEI